MRRGLLFALDLCISGWAFGEDSYEQKLLEFDKDELTLAAEQEALLEQIKSCEEELEIQQQHIDLLSNRIGVLNDRLGIDGSDPESDQTEVPVPSSDSKKELDELVDKSSALLVVAVGEDGQVGAAFLGNKGDKCVLFAPAGLVSEETSIEFTGLDGSVLSVDGDLSIPSEIDLVGLHTQDANLPTFDIAEFGEKVEVGMAVGVLTFDRKSRELKGSPGTIRGVGPDTLELDIELEEYVNGAPVVSLVSGKVIGILAPPVAGVAEEWAIGTRHQLTRNFATRIDRIKEWETTDLARFSKEADYIKEINHKTETAWIAYMLKYSIYEPEYRKLDPRQRRELKEMIDKEVLRLLENPFVSKMSKWIDSGDEMRFKDFKSSRDALEANEKSKSELLHLLRSMRQELKNKKPDLSAHLSSYHKKQYQEAMRWREECIGRISSRIDQVGR